MKKATTKDGILEDGILKDGVLKDGDIFRWSYNKETLKKLKDGNNGGTTYWCCSCIGVWDSSYGVLIDTYWTPPHLNKSWGKEEIKEKLNLLFVANMNNLREVSEKEFIKYEDCDCIDISHPNMMRGGTYVKKKAIKSADKKIESIKARIRYEKQKVDYHSREVEYLEKILRDGMDKDTFISYNKHI